MERPQWPMLSEQSSTEKINIWSGAAVNKGNKTGWTMLYFVGFVE